jgi:hypothetical protein
MVNMSQGFMAQRDQLSVLCQLSVFGLENAIGGNVNLSSLRDVLFQSFQVWLAQIEILSIRMMKYQG